MTALRRLIVPALKAKGYQVFGPGGLEQNSGIISFSSKKQDIIQLHNNLDAGGFVVSIRDSLDDNKYIRVSPHFYNTDEEIFQFLDNIPEVTSKD